jgi:hypothetical protein
MTQHRYALPLLTIAAAGVAACSGGSSGTGANGSAPGSLSVHLMDAPVEDVAEVHVQIAGLTIKPADAAAIELDLGAPTITVDLLELTDENAAVLIDGAEIPAGEYEWLEMEVNASFDGEMDSYVMTLIGGQEEIRVPSGRIRLVSGFEVGGGEVVQFLFDWSVRKGLVDPPGQPGFLLKPAFRVLSVEEFGVLSGTVDPMTLEDDSCTNDDDTDIGIGNVVYIYDGLDADPFDIDGTDPEPLATADVAQNTDGDYVYRVVLMPGDYTVAFTCEGGDDLPESTEALVFLAPTNLIMETDGEAVDF